MLMQGIDLPEQMFSAAATLPVPNIKSKTPLPPNQPLQFHKAEDTTGETNVRRQLPPTPSTSTASNHPVIEQPAITNIIEANAPQQQQQSGIIKVSRTTEFRHRKRAAELMNQPPPNKPGKCICLNLLHLQSFYLIIFNFFCYFMNVKAQR